MIEAVERLPDLRERVDAWRSAGERIGLVPTMGNLHAGHLRLVEAIRRHCDRVVTSIFVNPTQFGPSEDYEAYPRTREADLAALEEAGSDLAWVPPVTEMYPLKTPFMVQVPETLSNCLCGASRPGHFDGVATVVLKLFNQMSPDVAIFGEKDFQQLLILRHMAADLSLTVEIIGMETVREADGLAMSSRNAYLESSEREAAPELYRVLKETARGLRAGESEKALTDQAQARLQKAGFRPDYFQWRSAIDLDEPRDGEPSRLFAAAWLGRARLIDNISVQAKTEK